MYNEMLREIPVLRGESLEREILAVFASLVDEYREYRDRLLLRMCSERAKSNGHKQQVKFLLNIRKRIHNGVVELGKSLPREVLPFSR